MADRLALTHFSICKQTQPKESNSVVNQYIVSSKQRIAWIEIRPHRRRWCVSKARVLTARMSVSLPEWECKNDILCACPCGDRPKQTDRDRQTHTLRASGFDREAVWIKSPLLPTIEVDHTNFIQKLSIQWVIMGQRCFKSWGLKNVLKKVRSMNSYLKWVWKSWLQKTDHDGNRKSSIKWAEQT